MTVRLAVVAAVLLALLAVRPAQADELRIRPPGPTPIPVTIRLHLLDINSIRASEQSFSVLLECSVTWQDPRLEVGRTYAPTEVWTPPLEFANGADVSVHSDTVTARAGGQVERARKLRVTFNSPFGFRNFPFDQDRLHMILRPAMGVEDLTLTAIPNGMDRLLFDGEWEAESLSARSQPQEADFSFHVTRRFGFYLWSFFLPPFLIAVMAWGQYWVMPPNLQVTSNSVVALVAHKFAMANSMPHIGYLCYADAYFLVCLTWVFATHMTTARIMHLDELGLKQRRDRVRGLGRWSFPLGFGLGNVVIAFWFL